MLGMKKIEVDDYSFDVRPQYYNDYVGIFDAIDGVVNERVRSFMAGRVGLISRVLSWSGKDLKEKDCSDQNKQEFFALHPELIDKILIELGDAEEKEEKNSETSQAG